VNPPTGFFDPASAPCRMAGAVQLRAVVVPDDV
jgi:hypothetical protein